ncbi:MAG: hypothetical protein ACQES8_02450 [Thermodesulfobacteriota bacterium]
MGQFYLLGYNRYLLEQAAVCRNMAVLGAYGGVLVLARLCATFIFMGLIFKSYMVHGNRT